MARKLVNKPKIKFAEAVDMAKMLRDLGIDLGLEHGVETLKAVSDVVEENIALREALLGMVLQYCEESFEGICDSHMLSCNSHAMRLLVKLGEMKMIEDVPGTRIVRAKFKARFNNVELPWRSVKRKHKG